MIKNQLKNDLKKVVEELGFESSDIEVSIPQNPKFGDYSTNLPLQLAKLKSEKSDQPASPSAKRLASTLERGESPMEIAQQILSRLGGLSYLSKAEVAGPGFLNFYLKDKNLVSDLSNLSTLSNSREPKKFLVEYGHVNILKEIHIGHLRTFILGESVCRILESLGNQVFRANYQGDIGLHVAKAIWGIRQTGLPTKELSKEEQASFLGQAYAQGNKAYDEDPNFKQEIDQINIRLYQNDSEIMPVYQTAREWSLEYFEPIYALLGVKYDRCFFESEVAEPGKQIALENVGRVFEKNQGAIIFPGEKYGLHTRVFVTSSGNPTYEAKELGLAKLEYEAAKYDQSIHVVADEQSGYFQVVFKAIELILPFLKGKKYHLAYGFVDIKGGKMSSRTGNVVTADELVRVVSEKVREVMKGNDDHIDQEVVQKVTLGAIKFSYLKFSPKPNMIFDLDQSVSLQGDSGPYVQYTFARTQSIIRAVRGVERIGEIREIELTAEERALVIKLEDFNDIVLAAAKELKPNLICEYLLELAHLFNLFYQKDRVIGSETESFRLILTKKVGETLKTGLNLLGIEAPEKM